MYWCILWLLFTKKICICCFCPFKAMPKLQNTKRAITLKLFFVDYYSMLNTPEILIMQYKIVFECAYFCMIYWGFDIFSLISHNCHAKNRFVKQCHVILQFCSPMHAREKSAFDSPRSHPPQSPLQCLKGVIAKWHYGG